MPLAGWWIRAWRIGEQGRAALSTSCLNASWWMVGSCMATRSASEQQQRRSWPPVAPTMRPLCATVRPHSSPTMRPQSASFIQVGARGAHNAPTKRPLCAHYAPAPEAHPLCNAPAVHPYYAPSVRPQCAQSRGPCRRARPLCAHYALTVRPVPWALPACAPTMRHLVPPPCAPTMRHLVRPLCANPCAASVLRVAALLCWQSQSCLSALGGEYDVLALRAWHRFGVWLRRLVGVSVFGSGA